MEKVLVSRCLLGELCRWDGQSLSIDNSKLLSIYELIGICPEMDGGLPCPREGAEIVDGDGFKVLDGISRVKNNAGADVTDIFLRGAQAALNMALQNDIKKAILKDKSPSCGVTQICNDGQLKSGMGVTAALLSRHNLEILSIE